MARLAGGAVGDGSVKRGWFIDWRHVGLFIGLPAYVVVGFLTFGYGATRQCHQWTGIEVMGGRDFWVTKTNEGCVWADSAALPFSLLWPVYWAGRAAMEVTKP